MKQLGKSLLAGVGKAASFEDLAFGLGIATLIVALLSVFTVRRVQSGMNMHPGNAAAQSAFTTQVAFDEAKAVKKLPAALSGAWVKSLAIFAAAAVTLAGFGISLAL